MSRRKPVAVVGETGNGKTYLVEAWARKNAKKLYVVSGSAGATTDQLVGFHRPESSHGGIELVWQDGVLTEAVRTGGVFLFEEMSRAPQEIMGRLFSLTDTHLPKYSIPEKGGADSVSVTIHSDFRFVGCFNDYGAGYFVSRVDVAFLDRFCVIKMGYLPAQQELEVLNMHLNGHSDLAEGMLSVAQLSRGQKEGGSMNNNAISTRDLVLWAQMTDELDSIHDGFELAIAAKKGPSVKNHLVDIFGDKPKV